VNKVRDILQGIFNEKIAVRGNMIEMPGRLETRNQTIHAFDAKWADYELTAEKEKFYSMQKAWYLKLYGFNDEQDLAGFLRGKKVILDAGCGLGYKAAWFSELSPQSLVVGMDLSQAVRTAASNYAELKNLYFIEDDIGNTRLRDKSIDYVSCDQVIQHTVEPEHTFAELTRVLSQDGEFACYVYRKKALPRELIDTYFRTKCKELTHEELTEFSQQLTQLGKSLSALKMNVEVPDIPLLQIKAGTYDIQRFIYWNFLKCFWSDDLGYENSRSVNYDWYSPSDAKRFSKEEFLEMIDRNQLEIIHLHEEEACYSGRFTRK
jgi:ubiquinone/menaquinone biosynthesis C-methylase UbiE